MVENAKTQTMIDELCQKLHCSELAGDLERVNHARGLLAQLQQSAVLRRLHSITQNKTMINYASLQVSNVFLETKQRLKAAALDFSSSDGAKSIESVFDLEDSDFLEEEYMLETSFECDELLHDAWLGFFPGFDILTEHQTCGLSEDKQCIELSLEDDGYSIEGYLRGGIQCFMIDLFLGTEVEKQKLIFHLRESELKISKEYGFPINTTLFALLSPRLQYTGAMKAGDASEKLEKGSNVTLTTKRKYSACCSSIKFYVNARFLLDDCKEGDFILVGPAVQLAVVAVQKYELKCVVIEPGLIRSHLPVRFPARCSRSQVSLEELEDITFAREVGIKVLVSYMPGSPKYYEDLYHTLSLLKYDNLRLFTRLVLNEYEDEDIAEIEWIAKCYDGFLVEISCQKYNNCCQAEDHRDVQAKAILQLTTSSSSLMAKLFYQKKPIINSLIAERQLLVQPHNVPHMFQFPDKFLFSKESYQHAFSFFLLQKAFIENVAKLELPIQTFCASHERGDELLARACVALSFQSQIKAIVVCSSWPNTAIKLTHFRPEVPVVLVSPTKSFDDYISLYHRLIFMHFQKRSECNYMEYVKNSFLFSLIYLKTKKILHDGQSVLMVYATNTLTQFCDNYLIFEFKENQFPINLENVLST